MVKYYYDELDIISDSGPAAFRNLISGSVFREMGSQMPLHISSPLPSLSSSNCVEIRRRGWNILICTLKRRNNCWKAYNDFLKYAKTPTCSSLLRSLSVCQMNQVVSQNYLRHGLHH